MIEIPKSGVDINGMKRPTPKTGEAKWKDIEDLINRWARKQPRAAYDLEKYILETREGLADKRHGLLKGADNVPGTRVGLAIDPTLMSYIQAFYPNFLDTKEEMHEFMRRFPKFMIRTEV